MFVYVNDLAPIMAAIARVLAPAGVFAFTVETHGGDGAKLLPTLRYAHGAPYIRARARRGRPRARNYLAAATVRTEKGVPVNSLVVVAQASTP